MSRPRSTPKKRPLAEIKRELSCRLLAWYRAHHRRLPWRDTEDPYRVWVAEVMLQQTQAPTVLPYYERFLTRFPTVQALAEAPLEEVLKQWAGLGYYARARHLHRAAQIVVAEHGGQLPADSASLLALPGIGRYTAGAILSIAFHQDAPVLDGNVQRVFSRVFWVRGGPRSDRVKKRLWKLAEEVLPAGEAGDFNQALMEQGALICTPADPQCRSCCLSDLCEAYRRGQPTALPPTAPRPATERREDVVALIWRDGRVLIIQRPLAGVWGGLWEFPRTTRQGQEPLADGARRAAREVVGLGVEVGDPLPPIKHSVMHQAITLHGFHCLAVGGEPGARGCERWAWVTPEQLTDYAFPAPQMRLIEALTQTAAQWSLPLLDKPGKI